MSLRPEPVFPLQVFYDGSCPVCAREMAHYRALDRDGRLCFIDISGSAFDAASWGLQHQELMQVMHVRDACGRFYRGVNAFRVLWLGLPQPLYHWLSRLLGLPGLHLLAVIGYRGFARLRHRLPRRFPKRR
ncbi:MAG: DUF393 domain-containing protein [Syntrophotaleaceae bacterium]